MVYRFYEDCADFQEAPPAPIAEPSLGAYLYNRAKTEKRSFPLLEKLIQKML